MKAGLVFFLLSYNLWAKTFNKDLINTLENFSMPDMQLDCYFEIVSRFLNELKCGHGHNKNTFMMNFCKSLMGTN